MRSARLGTLTVALLALLGAYLVVTSRPAQAAETLLSQGKPVLASSVESAAFPAAAAVDGNNGTRWASSFADNQWLQVDLGSSQAVNRVVLRWEAAYARGFQLQTSSDGNAWTTIHTTTNGTGGEQSLVVNGNGRYVRVLITQRATQWGASLFEFQVYGGTPGGGPIVRVAEFLADCPYTHRLPDDPIVFPNLPGASHMHSFFGATVTNAHTTIDDLVNSPTSCNPATDKSSYWVSCGIR
ncbi:discoidin domain-containing protein [Kribbella catacumbae]|uniref:discoidin domain-containing protein n=1 Tax=Kribbella catacumbae TaxID=460086 RepID=UPI00039DEEDA|nr:discoidin domain-containing protein [Kribbella catacumbae]